jgi:Arc/MetJ-type ribon-helix-helix transcriptional regulator
VHMHPEYDPGMTKRVTVSLPDDVAAFLDEATNASAVVAEALRAQMDRAAATEAMLRAVGFEISAGGRERVRNHLSGLGTSEPSA